MLSTLRKPALLRIYSIPLLVMMTEQMGGAIGILYALELQADILQINLITTVGMVMGISLEIPFGMLSDRLGRKPMLLWSRTIVIAGTLIRLLATSPDHLLIASLFGGLAGGEFFPILLSMIGDVTEPSKRQEAISTMFLFSSFGMLIGPMICSSLLLVSGISLRNIYQIVIVAQVFLVIYILVQVRETKAKTLEGHKLNYRAHIMELIRSRNFQALLVMSFFFSLSRSIIQTYIPVYAKTDLHLSNAEVASFSIFSNLAVMIIRFLSATLLTRFQSGATLISVQVIGGVAGIISPLANSFVSIVLILFVSGISYGAERILSTVLVANNSKSQNRGVANSIFNVSQSTGSMSKIFTTSLVEASGFVPALIVGGIIGFATIIPPLLHRPLIDSLRTPSPETLQPTPDNAEPEGKAKTGKSAM